MPEYSAFGESALLRYSLPESMKKYQDHYFHKAKQENYPARSVYKLKEIQKRFKLFKPGMRVLDLGAAPGSWSLGAAEMIGPAGKVLGLDLKAVSTVFPPNVTFLQGDIYDPSPEFLAELQKHAPFHVVMSDMAPNTTGSRSTDQARSALLIEEALGLARTCLRPGGHFIVKFFMGPDIQAFAQALRKEFETVKSFKPNSSRSESFESFYVGMGFKTLPPHDPGGPARTGTAEDD